MICTWLWGNFTNNIQSWMHIHVACNRCLMFAGKQKTVNINLLFACLLRTSPTLMTDEVQPTLPTEQEEKKPRCLTAQMCPSAQPQPPTTAWPPEVMVVKHECFYSFGSKTQQNNCQHFRLLVGLLTLLGVKAIFHIAMVSPVVDRWFHVSQQACVWHHKRRKWSGLKDISSPAELSEVFVSSFHFAAAHFSFQLAATAGMPVKRVFIYWSYILTKRHRSKLSGDWEQ